MRPQASLSNILSFNEQNLSSAASARALLIPSFGINAGANAKADAIIASAGIEGDLNMIQANLAFQANARASELAKGLPPNLQVHWNANILSGKMIAYVKVDKVVERVVRKAISWLTFGLVRIKEIKSLTWKEEIYSFDGFSYRNTNSNFSDYVPLYCSRGKGACFFRRSPHEGGDEIPVIE
jgi:hypothetical protein